MASFFAVSSDAGASSSFTNTAGSEVTLDITPAVISPDTAFDIQTQLADSSWQKVGQLLAAQPSVVLTSAGTFRLYRYACRIPAGVDKT